MIGNLCTCDVENYGDLLYPVVFKLMMQSRKFNGDIRPFGFLEGPAPSGAGYNVASIAEFVKRPSLHLDAMVIGGGDIIRTDKRVLASHYVSLYRERTRKEPFQRLKKLVFGESDAVASFVKRFMPSGAVGPLILDAKDLPTLGKVAYCSCGVPFEFKERERTKVARAFDNASFIYVRDHQSADKLKRAGVGHSVEVAPDLIVTLSDFYDRDTEASRGREILHLYGVDTTTRILGFQCAPQSEHAYVEIAEQLHEFSKRAKCEVALVPIGHCHNDHHALEHLAEISNGAFKYIDIRSIWDMLSVLAACDMFLGTSMHANITAFSFGIPHVVGPLSVDKLGGFLEIVELDPALRLSNWTEAAEKLRMAEELGPSYFARKSTLAKGDVHKVMDKLTQAIKP